MKNIKINHLSTVEQKAIYALVSGLQAHHRHDINQVVLFGSKARGDSHTNSDIDILVITSRKEWPLQSQILRLGARVSLEHDVLFSLCPIDQEGWNLMSQTKHPLYRAIEKEGLNLEIEDESNNSKEEQLWQLN